MGSQVRGRGTEIKSVFSGCASSTDQPGQANAAERVAPPVHFPCTLRIFRGDLTQVSNVGDLMSIGIKVHNIEDQPILILDFFFKALLLSLVVKMILLLLLKWDLLAVKNFTTLKT